MAGAVRRQYGRLDVLFNNAGANVPPTGVHEMSYADWRMVVSSECAAPRHWLRHAPRHWLRHAPRHWLRHGLGAQ